MIDRRGRALLHRWDRHRGHRPVMAIGITGTQPTAMSPTSRPLQCGPKHRQARNPLPEPGSSAAQTIVIGQPAKELSP
jgi:hypothetical protein